MRAREARIWAGKGEISIRRSAEKPTLTLQRREWRDPAFARRWGSLSWPSKIDPRLVAAGASEQGLRVDAP